ncbi:hypothetical protein B0G69_6398 [Paraburkholderia sp. RAU2J]|nr:hypothetical protein B0G69_6398 [Paraburkholderia sp. RAU2J]
MRTATRGDAASGLVVMSAERSVPAAVGCEYSLPLAR